MAAASSSSAAAAADPPQGREVWRAFAGPFAHLPSTGTRVYYFPRGHADQCGGVHHLQNPPLDDAIPCTVSSVEVHYHAVSGDPYAVISLQREQGPPQQPPAAPQHQEHTATRYYVKKLTATSDRSPFTVPKACAQDLFPPLVRIDDDDRPEQTLHMVDVNGVAYEFNHILTDRGSNTLSAGWNKFSDDNKFCKRGQDAVVLMQRADGRLLIGSRRGGPNIDLGLQLVDNVHQAAVSATGYDRFAVTYYPRQGWPFVVPRKEVDDARALDWHPGMNVRMAIPVDAHELDSSRRQANTPDFFRGVITNVNNNNQWCKLQVDWVGSSTPNSNVNVWQVEAVEEAVEEAVVEAVVEPSTERLKTSDAPSSSAAGSLTSSGLDMKPQVKPE